MENTASPSAFRKEYEELKNYPESFDTFKEIYSIVGRNYGSKFKFKLGKLNKKHIKVFLLDNIIEKDGKDSYQFDLKGKEFSRLHFPPPDGSRSPRQRDLLKNKKPALEGSCSFILIS